MCETEAGVGLNDRGAPHVTMAVHFKGGLQHALSSAG